MKKPKNKSRYYIYSMNNHEKWKNLICVEEDNNHNNGNKDISI
jgi:hypothetical protein